MAERAFAPASPVRQSIKVLRGVAFLLVAFLLFSQTGLHPFAETGVFLTNSEGDFSKQGIVIGIAVLMLVLTWDKRLLRRNIAIPWPVLLLLAYCLVSVSWALAPDISLRRLALTAISVWLCFRSVAMLGYARSLHVLRWVLILFLLLNYLTLIFTPYGVHEFVLGDDTSIVGDWKGIMVHKNIAGGLCALTIILFLYDRRSFSSSTALVVIGFAAFFLYFTHSKTSMASLVIALPAGWAGAWLSERGASAKLLVGVILVLMGLQILSIYQGELIASFNDPHGFTGRSLIWRLLIDYANTHLWRGAGYGSFWQVGKLSPIWDYDDDWVAQLAATGHNGYLDLLVTIGLPGLLLALLVLFALPAWRLWNNPHMTLPRRRLLVAMMTFVAIHNLAESEIFDRMNLVHLFLILAIAWIEVDAAAMRHPRALLRQLGGRMRSLAS